MNKLCFFSSDARPLYKQDVFRAMSYPAGYVIHFRYQEKYIIGNLSDLEGKEALIYFSIGNDLNINEDQRRITHVSIREVIVKIVEKAEDTGQVHFYLELGDFKLDQLDSSNSPDIMPPNKFVTELKINSSPIAQWYQVIDSIKTSFPNQLFYKFQIKDKKKNKVLSSSFDKVENQSYYKLSDEMNYALEMAFYDTEPSTSNNYHGLKIEAMDGGLIQLVVPETIDLDARKDNRVYSIVTKTSSSSNAFTYINFSTILKSLAIVPAPIINPIIDTTLKVQVEKSTNRSMAFAFFTMLTASILAYGKLLTDQIDLKGNFSLSLTLQLILCIALGLFAVYKLYRMFDKK
jgi:hypothetical protein